MTNWKYIVLLTAGMTACLAAQAQEPQMSEVKLPVELKHPFIACTADELARLQKAWAGAGAEHDVVAAVVAQADKALAKPLVFPPRGGQHNQWYQCEACQLALKTVDDTHHQCPQCKKVYSGEPYDDVLYSRVHEGNIHAAYVAAWAFAITGKAEYARLTADVLLGYAQRYSQYPYHLASRKNDDSSGGGRLFEQTLNEASSMASRIAPAYDLVAASLSSEQRGQIRQGLLLPMLVSIDRHKAGKSNWQTFHNAAMLWGGAVLGDANWVNKSLSHPEHGFGLQMKVSVSAEGMWYENSWAYHIYTLSGLVKQAEGARRLGVDLWSHPALKKMFTLPARYTMPDGSLPRFGDDAGCTATSAPDLLEYAYREYHDPAIAPLLPPKPIWETVLTGRDANKPFPAAAAAASEVFGGAGHAVLRTQGAAGLTAVMTFGPYGGFHGHFDKLSFVLFGHGREVGVDPGRAASQAYRLPIHTQWYKATVSHNTVLIDGKSQEPAEGKLDFFAANNDYAAAIASLALPAPPNKYVPAEAGVFRRALCLTPAYALVVDVVRAPQAGRLDWIYHNRGQAVRCDRAAKPRPLDGGFPGREYINNVLGGEAEGGFVVEFTDAGGPTRVVMAAGGKSEVRIGDGVGGSILDRVPLMIVTRSGSEAVFAAAIEPLKTGDSPRVKSVEVRAEGDGFVVTVGTDAGPEEFTLAADALTIVRGGKTVLAGDR